MIEMFSRNFGKEAAIYAGFQKASGDLVTVIDADLQQRPEIVVKMVKILLENEEYDCVAAYQEERHEGKMVGGLKNMFYKIINKTSEIEFYPGASDFQYFSQNCCGCNFKVCRNTIDFQKVFFHGSDSIHVTFHT